MKQEKTEEQTQKKKKILFVDDDDVAIKEFSEFFKRHNWSVVTASNGKEAQKKLEKIDNYYVMVLDLDMPVMTGIELLEILSENDIKKPPIIVLSGALGEKYLEVVNLCQYLGAASVLQKTDISFKELLRHAEFIGGGSRISNIPFSFLPNTIDHIVNRRERALKVVLESQTKLAIAYTDLSEPVFIVGRRWNSWYPSIFPVLGGAYAIVAPRSVDGDKSSDEGLMPSVVIDPGFNTLEIFRNLNISVSNIESCIITHNHPDHIGGIFEFMAARHAIGKRTKAFFNPSTCEMLKDCSGFSLEVTELDGHDVDIIKSYQIENRFLQIQAKGFNTYHEEIGRANSSKGLIITIKTGKNINNLEETAEMTILGDTSYNHANHFEEIVPNIVKNITKLIVLHIGSSQIKQATGKHLYFKGLKAILSDIDGQLHKIRYQGKLLIIVSEWGLEHATKKQLMTSCKMSLKGFNDISPIKETIKLLQSGLEKIILLPADLGLRIGMITGRIYLQDDSTWSDCSADEIAFEVTDDGIHYSL